MSVPAPLPATLGDEPAHYARLGLHPTLIAAWEDGLRTDPAARSLEWWYYDCHLDDGTRVTVELHTKPPIAPPSTPLAPFVTIVLVPAEGPAIVKNAVLPATLFSASRTGCDVVAGPNFCRGDLTHQTVHAEIDDVSVDLDFVSTLAPWRPATGHFFLGAEEERHFAWFLPMPRARVTAVVRRGGETREATGIGYHDHNWGNAAPASLIDHWYWGHAHAGDYTFVALHAYSHVKYGQRLFQPHLLARGAERIGDGSGGFGLSPIDETVEPRSGVPAARALAYEVEAGGVRHRIRFERRRDVMALGFGPAGGYLRFVGAVEIARDGEPPVSGDGQFEVLSFGPRQRLAAV